LDTWTKRLILGGSDIWQAHAAYSGRMLSGIQQKGRPKLSFLSFTIFALGAISAEPLDSLLMFCPYPTPLHIRSPAPH
jgi:hypothetical protein